MLKRVLVPLDGSMLAESALEPALHLARQTAGTVYLMRVPDYNDSGAQSGSEYHQVLTDDGAMPEYEDAAAYLREKPESITEPGVAVRTIVAEGDRANAIVNTAATSNVDIIVMASHTRTGVSRWLLGSVAGKVIRQAQSPVLLIRQLSNYAHILITLDGSALAERVVEPALAVAASFGSRITFLQVDDASEASPNHESADRSEPESGKESYLERTVSRCEQSGLEMETITLQGPVAEGILSYAAQNNVD